MDVSFSNYDFYGNDDASFILPESSEPVWILGKSYSAIYDLEEIKSDVRTRFWFTYRKGFPSIGTYGPTMDTGWGCMLRCGQMILAQALVLQSLGRDFRWDERVHRSEEYNSILSRFLDHKRACYSVHQIALMGESEGKKVGEWFGPNTVAQVLKKLSNYDVISGRLSLHIAMDNLLIIEEVNKACKTENGFWTPLLLFIPLRLGLTEMNAAYVAALKSCLCLRESVGIIGGKPNHAYYFIGFIDNQLLYLDPHKTQAAPLLNFTSQMEIKDVVEATQNLPDESYHSSALCRMDFAQIDPSIALGFYCHTESDFQNLCKSLRVCVLDKQPMLFELCEKSPTGWNISSDSAKSSRCSASIGQMHDPPTAFNAKNRQQQTTEHGANSDSDSDYELLG